jgi:hypothetical protein
MAVYQAHPAKALLPQDNGSCTGNKSYGSDLNFLNQPPNLLSKNCGFCLTAVTETLTKLFPATTLTGFCPVMVFPIPEGLEDLQFGRFTIEYNMGRELESR